MGKGRGRALITGPETEKEQGCHGRRHEDNSLSWGGAAGERLAGKQEAGVGPERQ